MIIRCNNCNSTFAVDDDKVANKKFAFTCPSCNTENIFDNRNHEPISATPPIESKRDKNNIPESEVQQNFENTPQSLNSNNNNFDHSQKSENFAEKNPISAEDDSLSNFSDEIANIETTPSLENNASNDDIILDEFDNIIEDEKGVPNSTNFEFNEENNTSELNLEIKETDSINTDFPVLENEDFGNEISPDALEFNEAEISTSNDNSPDNLEITDEYNDSIFDENKIEEETTNPKSSLSSEKTDDVFSENTTLIDLDEDDNIKDILTDNDTTDKFISEEKTINDKAIEFDFNEELPESNTSDKLEINLSDESLDFDNIGKEQSEQINLEKIESDLTEIAANSNTENIFSDSSDNDIAIDVKNIDADFDEKTNVDISPDYDSTFNFESIDLDQEKNKSNLLKKSREDIDTDEEDQDESITIDLDSLDLEISAQNSSTLDEISEEDEKLTLDDAGLTFEELTSEEQSTLIEDNELEEDLRLSLNDIDPNLKLESIADDSPINASSLPNIDSEPPEINIDKYEEKIKLNQKIFEEHELPNLEFVDEELLLDDSIYSDLPSSGDAFDEDGGEISKRANKKGITSFLIYSSLNYSRQGAFLRLTPLYLISMIPHFISMIIYTTLSLILGFINQIIILSTGECVKDFLKIIENTTRYFFYIQTNIIGIIESRPIYAGRKNSDHQLQMNIMYPLKYSKNMAILRLSIIGILFYMLPHLIMVALLSLLVPFAYLMGITAVLFTNKWPEIFFTFLTGYFKYLALISTFMIGLTDNYPKFKLKR